MRCCFHIEHLIRNPTHPSLRNEKLSGTEQWAFSIAMNYRATYLSTEKGIVITAVGGKFFLSIAADIE